VILRPIGYLDLPPRAGAWAETWLFSLIRTVPMRPI
jgi:hypothetical protein